MSVDQPTQTQADQSVLAQHEFAETLDRMVNEGLDYRSILAGAGAALASSIMRSAGPAMVPKWFAIQARIAADYLNSKD